VVDADPDRAKARFDDLKRSLDGNIDIASGRQSFRQYMERYLDTVMPNEVRKQSTASNYTKRAGYYILPTLGDYRLDALTTAIGQAWVNAMLAKGWARSSVKQALALSKRVLDRAVAEHLIPYNPFAAIKPPVDPPRQPMNDEEEEMEGIGKVMSPEQIEAFLQAVVGDWLEPLYLLAFLGLRRGELLGLRWKDYDPEKLVLRVRQQVVELDGKPEITSPKTRSSRRTIPVPEEYLAILDRYHTRWLERKMKHPDTWQDYGLMFCTRNGTPMTPRNLLRHFHQALERAKLGEYHGEGDEKKFQPWFRLHDLRHTANQRMKDAGVDAKVRAAILGHASIRVTEEVYSHVDEAAKRDAINRVRKNGT
jgi:integrase